VRLLGDAKSQKKAKKKKKSEQKFNSPFYAREEVMNPLRDLLCSSYSVLSTGDHVMSVSFTGGEKLLLPAPRIRFLMFTEYQTRPSLSGGEVRGHRCPRLWMAKASPGHIENFCRNIWKLPAHAAG
jgi:hypothetical protein